MEFKTKGNDAMGRRDFGAAVQQYSKGISVLEGGEDKEGVLPILYSNRAQANLNMKKYAECIQDCSHAIELKPAFIKSFLRRGSALLKLSKFEEAEKDFEHLSNLSDAERNNGGVDLEAIQEGLKEIQKYKQAKQDILESGPMGERIEGERWLQSILEDKNKKVQKLPSGILFEVLTPVKESDLANKKSPKLDTETEVNYHGCLKSGKVFDTTEGKEPAVFRPVQLIPAWSEVLQYMVEGEKWRIYVPQHLAYGKEGAGADIPPYSALDFILEIVSVVDEKVFKTAAEGRKNLEKQLGGKKYEDLLL